MHKVGSQQYYMQQARLFTACSDTSLQHDQQSGSSQPAAKHDHSRRARNDRKHVSIQ